MFRNTAVMSAMTILLPQFLKVMRQHILAMMGILNLFVANLTHFAAVKIIILNVS